MEQSLPAHCTSDSWQQMQSNSAIRECLAPAGHHARNNRAKAELTSPQLYKENNPPQQNDDGRQQHHTSLQASSNGSSAAAPATPQQRPPPGSASTFKQRVQAKMAELERSIQKIAPGHSRLASTSVTDDAAASQDSVGPPSKLGGRGGGSMGALPMLSPLEADSDPLRSPSNSRTHSRNSASDPAVQRLAYQSAGSGPPDGAAAEWSLDSRFGPVLDRARAELEAARRQLVGSQEQLQRLQVSVAHEHEARLVAERSLSEANAAALPASAAAELNIKEVVDLRRGLAAAECTAESRRKALLAEKAKAQNALGQLAISREKVKLAQSRLQRQQQDADAVAAQLTERTAECCALAEELAARPPAGTPGGLPFAEQEAMRSDLEIVQRQLQASHGASADLRCQVDLLQQKLAQVERRARMAAATGAAPEPAAPPSDSEQLGPSLAENPDLGVAARELAAARKDLTAAQAEVAALQKQERRQRQRGEAAEREAARLQDELQAAREEATHLGKAATNAQLAAAEAERTLLDQALEMDDLQQAAGAVGRLQSETDELRAAEAAAQLRATEAVRESEQLRVRLAAAQQAASQRGSSLAEQQRELKQVQTARAQQQRALERQDAKIEQLKAALTAREAELTAQRMNAKKMQHARTAAENWLDD